MTLDPSENPFRLTRAGSPLDHFYFSVLLLPYFSRYYFARIDCVADEGVGPEDFEDPEDFAQPGKKPFDHTVKPFYTCHIALVVVASES